MVKTVLAFVIGFAVLGLVGNSDRKVDLAEQMVSACEAQAYSAHCQQLINEVQADGQHEVMTDGAGRFWVEQR